MPPRGAISAFFSSILAGALYEPVGSLIIGWRPDYGYGLAFMGVFILAFGTIRIVADKFIKGNVRLQIPIDRARRRGRRAHRRHDRRGHHR